MSIQDIESRIDWQQFYSVLKKAKISGKEVTALCPFHDDKNASFSANLVTGLWYCHACGAEGNAMEFLKKFYNTGTKEAIHKLAEIAGMTVADSPDVRQKPSRITLQDYSDKKKLPLEFLESLGMKDAKTGVSVPYMNESGEVIATRTRHAEGGGPRFSWKRGSKVLLYGLWRLQEAREKGYVILVEGESDAQTLWHNGFPALGVPGATSFQSHWVSFLSGLKLYLHQEPDAGGEAFIRKTCQGLVDARWEGETYVIDFGGRHKDPSECYIQLGEGFAESLQRILENARRLDISEMSIKPEEVIPGAPTQLRMPAGWRCSERGIHVIKDEGLVPILPVPLLLSRRLRSIDTGEEKIELAYQRDNKWHTVISNRSTVFQNSKLTMLSDKGIPITSENSKNIVRYLGDLEAENLDNLPVVRSTERMGWIDGKRFLPGLADDIVLDISDSGSVSLANSYHERGNFEEWKEALNAVRVFPIARFMVSASFASPLLSILGHRVFIVHAWGPSRGGKTTALKAALSVWGEPESLMANFNATKVALERMASFYNDLPLGIDERQVVGDKQGLIEGLVYMLGMGKGKARGTRGGGLQSFNSWRTIALTTGEEPLSSSTSQTGVMTRALEVSGKPIPDESFARSLHKTLARHYGYAGTMFVKKIMELDPDTMTADYEAISTYLESVAPENIGSHISAVAIVCLADYYASQWIFGIDEDSAYKETIELANTILSMLDTEEDTNYDQRAWEYLQEWLVAYKDRFDEQAPPPHYGWFSTADKTYYVIPFVLEDALKNRGYSPRRVLKDLADTGHLVTSEKGGKRRYKVNKYYDHKWSNFIAIKAPESEKPEN